MKCYSVEWLDRDSKYHQDYFFPVGVNLITTSFYHLCASPRGSAIAFLNELLNGGITEVKFKEIIYKE
jgi:hypothetical protein